MPLYEIAKFISNPYILSFLALAISFYTLWDSNFHFKLGIAAGKQSKLFVANIDGVKKPCIFMSLALSNYGGKTGYLNDVKLRVKLKSDRTTVFDEEFISIREYDTILGDGATIQQTEILPTVIVGKTTEVKKYVFVCSKWIEADDIPIRFDLDVDVLVKEGIKWKSLKSYEIKNVADIWKDFEPSTESKMVNKDVFEKN